MPDAPETSRRTVLIAAASAASAALAPALARAAEKIGAARPEQVVAMTRYADFLLLSETAREHGYRARLIDQAPPDGAALFVWTADKA